MQKFLKLRHILLNINILQTIYLILSAIKKPKVNLILLNHSRCKNISSYILLSKAEYFAIYYCAFLLNDNRTSVCFFI